MNPSTTDQTTPEQDLHERSKYEMSLAEFPLAFLSTRAPKDTRALIYEDEIAGKNGRKVKRRWEITPHASLGFPTSSTQSTFFELFQLWAEQQFASRHIYFGSIYELIKRKGLKRDDGESYQRIRDDLERLIGITVKATNAFWDNKAKAYVTRVFHLFESVDFFYADPDNPEQSTLPLAKITASPTLWQSVASNAIIALQNVPRGAFHGYTPTEQRLALYLAKMLHNKPEHRRNADTLTSQIPITAKLYKKRKQLLSRACDGLIAKAFPYLTSYRYEGNKRGSGENIIFTRKMKQVARPTAAKAKEDMSDEEAKRNLLVSDILGVTGDAHSKSFYTLVAKKVREQTVYRAIAATRQAYLQGEIKTTRARYFTGIIKQLASEEGVSL
jgi:hypothetical protein